jgi:two-component system response regulator LytT
VSLRVLIVDDEAPARSELRFLLERIDGVEVVGEAASAREALALAEHVGYDLVFLDIQMPGGAGGIEAARRLRALPDAPSVVFVTAHDDRAVQAFAVDAADYVLKPVREERLLTAVRRVRATRGGSAGPGGGPVRVPTQGADGSVLLIDPDSIAYAEADRDHAWVVTVDGLRHSSPRSLRELEDLLPNGFLRIHRSHLVNLARVAAVEQAEGGGTCVRVVEPVGVRLAVARRQVRSLRSALGLR